MQTSLTCILVAVMLTIANLCAAQTRPAKSHVDKHRPARHIVTLNNFDFGDPVYCYGLELSQICEPMDTVIYSFSGKQGPFISKQWILEHPLLTPSIAGYTVLGFELSWLKRRGDYQMSDYRLAPKNSIFQMVESFNSKDSDYVYIENVRLEKDGKAYAPPGKPFFFRVVE